MDFFFFNTFMQSSVFKWRPAVVGFTITKEKNSPHFSFCCEQLLSHQPDFFLLYFLC